MSVFLDIKLFAPTYEFNTAVIRKFVALMIKELLLNSNQLYYLQLDSAGRLLECNVLFSRMCELNGVMDINLLQLTTTRGTRIITAAMKRARRRKSVVSVRLKMKLPLSDTDHIFRSAQIGYYETFYIILGWDSFVGETEDPYILAKQSAQLREIAHIYSHHINRWVANISGLLPMINRSGLDNESSRIFDMIDDAAAQLRREIQLISKLAE